MAALIALSCGLVTFVGWDAVCPVLAKGRFARPFHRIPFPMLFATVLAPAVIAQGETQPSATSVFLLCAGGIKGQAMYLPASPLRLVMPVIGAVPRKACPALPRCGGRRGLTVGPGCPR
ncbi:MAG: hypothetical protein INF48_02540 [Rhodobacter sp.]|nr:hypothetical protein [Rhodobacter sp.]